MRYFSRFHFFLMKGAEAIHPSILIFSLCFFLLVPCLGYSAIAISNITDLQKIGNDPGYPLDGEYELTQDIDASETINWKLGDGFQPIGTKANPFIGKFDGKGHKITNLFIDKPSSDYVGLFGYVGSYIGSGGIIQNVRVEELWLAGNNYVGGLVGFLDLAASVINCNVHGYVSGNVEVGGLLGRSDNGIINNCSFNGSVYGFEMVGGLIGKTYYGKVDNCCANAFVSGYFSVGGLLGMNSKGKINTSYATGELSGAEELGGLIGANAGEVKNSYSMASISMGAMSVGGLVGYNEQSVENCYSIGFVSGGGPFVGGLIGWNGGSVTNSYWNIESSGRTTSDGGEGKTTSEMEQQATFIDWDFTTIWGINEGISYPYLLWQGGPAPEPEGMIEGMHEGNAEGETLPPHSADQNKDWQINLIELLRVIQLYNSGGYHCDLLGEDGYALGPGEVNCSPHSSDCNPQDWKINLPELLRIIQIYNIGIYHACQNRSEDNYCPG